MVMPALAVVAVVAKLTTIAPAAAIASMVFRNVMSSSITVDDHAITIAQIALLS